MHKRLRKLQFYARAVSQQFLIPDAYYRARFEQTLSTINQYDPAEIQQRVSYYNQLSEPFQVSDDAASLREIPYQTNTMSYYDYREVLRYFPVDVRTDSFFSDINWLTEVPSLVKARPIEGDNTNSVLMKMRKVRHFLPIRDRVPFHAKKDRAVWRGAAWQVHRKKFVAETIDCPLADIGQVNPESDEAPASWVKPYMSVRDQLKYKFILSVEGHDVATNLKWIAQSNSVCVMTRPRIDDWFMAAKLKPFVHYIEVEDDYSDLTEKLEYYIRHPRESQQLIRNFQQHHRQFEDPRKEHLIGMLVVKKYLEKAGQLQTATLPLHSLQSRNLIRAA